MRAWGRPGEEELQSTSGVEGKASVCWPWVSSKAWVGLADTRPSLPVTAAKAGLVMSPGPGHHCSACAVHPQT